MLITMQVTIGKAKVNLSDEKIMSPGNLPNGRFFLASILWVICNPSLYLAIGSKKPCHVRNFGIIY